MGRRPSRRNSWEQVRVVWIDGKGDQDSRRGYQLNVTGAYLSGKLLVQKALIFHVLSRYPIAKFCNDSRMFTMVLAIH